MENNPFYDASLLISDADISDKFMDAAIMWDAMTDGGKNVDESDLAAILAANDLDDLLDEYYVYSKKYGEFDMEALKTVIENWTYEY